MLLDNEDSCHLIENTYRDPKSNRRGRTEASQLDTALLIVVPRKKVFDGYMSFRLIIVIIVIIIDTALLIVGLV